MADNEKLVFMVTHGPSEAELATIPFVMAGAALASDVAVVIGFQGDAVRLMAAGASLYLLGSLASTLYGSFPVPLVGAGAGPVLGWYGLALAVGTTTGRRALGAPPSAAAAAPRRPS